MPIYNNGSEQGGVDSGSATDAAAASATATAIKAVTDLLPNGGALTALAANAAKAGTVVNTGGTATIGAILGDFGNTTLISLLTAIKAKTDTIA